MLPATGCRISCMNIRRLCSDVKVACRQFEEVEALYRAIKNGEVDLGFSDLSFAAFDEISTAVIDTIFLWAGYG